MEQFHELSVFISSFLENDDYISSLHFKERFNGQQEKEFHLLEIIFNVFYYFTISRALKHFTCSEGYQDPMLGDLLPSHFLRIAHFYRGTL